MTYQLIINSTDFINFIRDELNPHYMRYPEKKFWESIEQYGERERKWQLEKRELIIKFVDFYKRDFPDFYDDKSWNPINYGFTRGNHKTFYVCIKKLEGENE